MGHSTNMDDEQRAAMEEFTREKGIDTEFFKMEDHAEFLKKKLMEIEGEEKKDMESVPRQIQRLEEKVDRLTNLLNHIFGKHVLINSQWRELTEVPESFQSKGGGE